MTFTDEQLEAMRLAVEDELVYRRDARISVMRNNGLVIKERTGEFSSVIRMGFEEAVVIGLRALEKDNACPITDGTGSLGSFQSR